MRNSVLTPPASNVRAREALLRALERFPATIEESPLAEHPQRLLQLASDPEMEWVVIADADVVLQADAFGALRRAAGPRTAIVGGRALVAASQRLGYMFGPPRSGPNPFDLVSLVAPQSDRTFTEFVRGPVDAPQRGAYVVSAAFARTLAAAALDPVMLHLDLAVQARAAGREIVCEPSLAFAADEDSLALRHAFGDLRRYAGAIDWKTQELHRDPPRFRPAFVTREVRVMGNIRGYARRPYPPLDVLIVAADEISRARAQRTGVALARNGSVTVCAPGDADMLRAALMRTGDRYLLVADAAALPERTGVEALVERIERSGRLALALEKPAPPYGAALFHCGRIVNAQSFAGERVFDVVAGAVERLPQRRLFATTPAGDLVPAPLPPVGGRGRLDAVFVAGAKPAATQQSLQALLGETVEGATLAVYAAGAATTERLFTVHTRITLVPDDSDVQLAVGLNRALGACTSDHVAIVRDDVQLPHGALERLNDAFGRIPRLGVAVPRLGGSDRPESLPDLGYRNSAEMQASYERRADAFAREATLLEVGTSPVLIVSREVLDVVGGFDERFGFSRLGVEDFTRRVRSANFLVACCEDSYGHLFPAEEAGSLIANLDNAPFLRAAYERRWSQPRGFDPATDRVALRENAVAGAPQPPRRAVRVLVPLHDEEELASVRPLLIELAAAFRVNDPVEVVVGLDGPLAMDTALSALRELLLASGIPMEETINVSIDFVYDHVAWRDAGENNVRAAGRERDVLADVPVVGGAAAVHELLSIPLT